MRTLALALLLPLLVQPARAQDFGQALAAVKARNGDIPQFLTDAYAANKGNPDYFVKAANYWWGVAQQVNLTTQPSAAGGFSVRNKETGQEVGSITTVGQTDPAIPQKAVDLLAEAAMRFPERADIHLGLAYLQHGLRQDDACAMSLNRLLDRCATEPATLTWKDGGAFPEVPATYLPRSMQKYAHDFLNEATKEGDERCRKLCEHLIQVYPDHPYAYNNLAALSHAQKDDAACLRYLQAAAEKAPNDTLVRLNLGDAFARAGDKAKARAAYEKAAQDPDPEMQTAAKRALQDLAGAPRKKK